MQLAKSCLDVGLYTEDLEAHQRFWVDELGLAYEGYQKIGGGVRQHRYGLNGSVLKVNHARDPLPTHPTGLQRLVVATDRVDAPEARTDPDGTRVDLVPVGHGGVAAIAVEVGSADPDEARRWWIEAVGADDLGGPTVRVGTTLVHVVGAPGRQRTGPMRATGLRYLTVQVHDVVAEHERLVAWGADAPMPPQRLGDTAVIAFVRSPDGDWLELSQRADLTGPLPDV